MSRCSSTKSQDKLLSGKSAVITGSTSGIGLSIAKLFAKNGANILINGFGERSAIDKLVAELTAEYGVKVEYSAADLTKSSEAKQIVKDCVQQFGTIDILCNNAGIQHTSPIESFPEETYHKLISLHLNAPFFAMQEAIPHMRSRKWGRIINTASVHGIVASVNKAPYVSAKHAVVGLTKAVALETAGSGITVNSVAPGWVLTPLIHKQITDKAAELKISFEEAQAELLRAKMPSLQMVTEEQLAGVFLFLCSPAADQITGITLPVDGGWTSQ